MLDLALVRAEPARVKAALARRGVPPERVDAAVDLDRRWSARQEVREALRTRRRQISSEVARRKTAQDAGGGGGPETLSVSDLIRAGRQVARDLQAVDHSMGDLAARREAALLALPNLPASDVPDSPPDLDPTGPPWPKPFPPLPHWDLMEMLGLAGSAGASAGSGFLLWRGQGARLVRGLVRFMLDVHVGEGREEVLAPPVATRWALTGSAHLPTLEEKLYRVVEPGRAGEHAERRGGSPHPPRDAQDERGRSGDRPRNTAARRADACDADLYLAPRAEPHLAALHAGEVLEAGSLPHRLVAAATALRRESHGGGAAGRGLLRLHAFPTVEVYTLCRPAESEAELASAVDAAETILERLGVAHRRRVRAATELSHAAARTVSLDVWCPGLPAEEYGGVPGDDTEKRGGSPHPPRDGQGARGPYGSRNRGDCGAPGLASRPGHTTQPTAAGPRGRWVEVSALSSFTDYQARRADTRFRAPDGRARLVHTVGGAAVAAPRLIAALLETGQEADGSVRLPAALEPYVGTAVLGAARGE